MLYKFLYSLSHDISVFNVFRYITFRTFLAFLTAFLICLLWGPAFIRRLTRAQVKQTIRDDGPQAHKKKVGTPTMGGLLILSAVFIPSILWGDVYNPYVFTTLIVTFFFALVGYFDDWFKVKKKNSKGISGRLRLFIEFSIVIVVMSWMIHFNDFSTSLYVPFFKNIVIELGWFYVVFASFTVVGCANAVNLTDGLDGLAIVPVIIAVGTFALFAYLTGHYKIASYLQIPFISGVGELAPIAATVIAAGLGFLWYNTYPATVFMGDIGSLSLGGFLGMMAVLTKNEILLALVGGIFVLEALSTIIQVASFKMTGKRVFKMAPLHHHYELKGIDETKIIVRFWIIAILLAVISLSTLKLR